MIKKADRRQGVLTKDSVHYEQILCKHVEYKVAHNMLSFSCDNKTMRANNSLIKKYTKSFLKQKTDYLTNLQHKSGSFYGLP